ncbi:putative reverse transcriptase domain-containing protein, partial [Tanacetum coccineum]
MTAHVPVRVSVPAPFGGVTDWYPEQGYREPVILFGAILAIILVIPEVLVVQNEPPPIVTPEVGTVSVVSPSRVLNLVDYSSSSDFDPLEDSLPPALDLPLVLPFLCSDDTKADGESEPAEQRNPFIVFDTLAPLSEFPLEHCTFRSFLSGHTPPDTTDADSSTPQRFVHRSLARTPRHSEAFRRWRSTPLSTPYPPTTSDSSLGSSSERRIAEKSFREVDTADAEAVADVGISGGVVAHPEDGVGIGFEIVASDVREDDEEFEAKASAPDTIEIVVDPLAIGDSSESSRGGIPNLEDTIYDIVHYMSEVHIDRITEIETTQRQLETSQMVASGERASLVERIRSLRLEYLTWHFYKRSFVRFVGIVMILGGDLGGKTMTITHSGMTSKAIEELINRRVEETLAAYEATHVANALEDESQSQNGSDGDNGNGRNGNGGNENGGNGNGGNGNPNENDKGVRLVAREYTYQDFMKCQPHNFKGTEGVVMLIRWFEKMETVFHISNFPEKYQVKYATCTLLNSALTWWNSHKRTIRVYAAFSMSWIELMKLMAEVYCPWTKIQKMESELCNLTMKNKDLAAYTQRFQELTMLCTKMVPEEEDRVKKFIGGLPDNIQGNMIAAKPTRLQDVVWIANNLIDQKLKGYAVKSDKNKRKFDNSQKENRRQQLPFKRQNVGGQNVAKAYTDGNNERRVYNGPLPLRNKCKFHHEGPCTIRYGKCNKIGHLTLDCKATNSTTSN